VDDPRDARAALLGSLGSWPAPVEWERLLASTSDRLKEWARDGAPEWTVVLADEQSEGRGRHGARWVSRRGDLFLSVLMRPSPGVELGVLPLLVGVAVRDGLLAFGVEATLKWPNDVLVGGRKIGGILTEASWSEGAVDSVVVGIGVNVGLRAHGLPPEIAGQTTSLWIETQRLAPVVAVAAQLLQALRLWYHALAVDGPDAILKAWRSRAVSWWGRVVEVRSGDDVVRGVARDVERSGALVVELADGKTVSLIAGVARELRVT
jgi:BirA family transcriptional regulator, biotin operon repressor / biotin---[acetyl-CoA-carboxylase] ligase